MQMRNSKKAASLFALACAVTCALLCASACSQQDPSPEQASQNEATQSQAPSAESAGGAMSDFEKSVDAAQAAARIEAQRQEGQRVEENNAAALQAAFDANPTAVETGVDQDGKTKFSDLTELTGTVRIKQGLNRATNQYQDVCMLVLPSELTLTDTQQGDVHDDTVILDESYEVYSGKIISVRLSLGAIPTYSIPSSSFSVIHGKDGYVTNVF